MFKRKSCYYKFIIDYCKFCSCIEVRNDLMSTCTKCQRFDSSETVPCSRF